MSVLTKVFVVLTTVMAVLLVPLMIAYVNNTAHFKRDLQEEKQLRTIAQQRASILETEKAGAQNAVADVIAAKEQEIAQLQARINEQMDQLSTQQIAIVDLRDRVANKDAAIDRLTAGQQQSAQIIAMLEEEVQRRRAQALEAEGKFVELNDEIQAKTTTVNTLVEQVRLMKEQMAELQKQLVAAASPQAAQPAALAAGAVASPLPDRPIRGIITDVQTVGDEVFVAVNVGANDQVVEGMQFIIHEGDTYVGSLTITKVDLNSSAGRITMTRSEIKPSLEILATAF